MPKPLDYYAPESLSAAFYDLVAACDPTLEGDLAFYETIAPEGSWVLELGCGTGRIGLALAQKDRAVVGLDLAPAMLARAEAKRARLAPEVIGRTAFVQADMTRFALNHTFDAAISPFFSVSHLPAGEPRRAMLRATAQHLKPGGVAALHVVLPSGVTRPLSVDPEKPVIDVAYGTGGGRFRLYVAGQRYDRDKRRFDQTLDYVQIAPNGAEARRSRERLSYYVSDLEAEAKGSGLVLEEKISPFNRVGEMWVFRKAGPAA